MYSGFKDANTFDEAGVDNLDETPQSLDDNNIWQGLPGWWVLNCATQYKVSSKIQLNINLDNLFDAHYKTFGSGISASGRNFVVSLTSKF